MLAEDLLEHRVSSVWTMTAAWSTFHTGGTRPGLQRFSCGNFHICFCWDHKENLSSNFLHLPLGSRFLHHVNRLRKLTHLILSGSAVLGGIFFFKGCGLGPMSENFLNPL